MSSTHGGQDGECHCPPDTFACYEALPRQRNDRRTWRNRLNTHLCVYSIVSSRELFHILGSEMCVVLVYPNTALLFFFFFKPIITILYSVFVWHTHTPPFLAKMKIIESASEWGNRPAPCPPPPQETQPLPLYHSLSLCHNLSHILSVSHILLTHTFILSLCHCLSFTLCVSLSHAHTHRAVFVPFLLNGILLEGSEGREGIQRQRENL